MAIKGKTTIELTDVDTGEKETYVDENMVTNGVQNFLNPYGIFANYPYRQSYNYGNSYPNYLYLYSSNAWQVLTGGIFLFDTEITEDSNTVFPPAGAKMIGNACIGLSNSGEVTEFGSYNETESGVQEDGSIKMVYDFSTQQANGGIKSVCLTSHSGGCRGFGNFESMAHDSNLCANVDEAQYYASGEISLNPWTEEKDEGVLYADYAEDCIYWINPANLSSINGYTDLYFKNTSNITIHKGKAHLKNIDLFTSNEIKSFESTDYSIPSDILTYVGSSSIYASAYADGKTIYVVFAKNAGGISSGSYVYIMKIAEDGTVSAIKFYNNTGEKIDIRMYGTCCVKNGKIYLYGYSRNSDGKYNFYEIDIADSTQVRLCTSTEDTTYFYNIDETNNIYSGAIGSTDSYQEVFNIDESAISYTNNITYKMGGTKLTAFKRTAKILNAPTPSILTNVEGKLYLIKDNRYLATINNLTTPVVKTASKTMKITYTLSMGESE